MTWWLWLIVISWPVLGLVSWFAAIIPSKELKTSDLAALPIIIAFGWISFGIWLWQEANENGRTLIKW